MKNLILFLDYIPQFAGLMLRALFRSKWLLFVLIVGLAYYFVICDVVEIFTEIQSQMQLKYIIK